MTSIADGSRRENDAEHSRALAMMALLFHEYMPHTDILKVIKMVLIHDLVEIYECPLCGGAGILEEDCGSSYYVTCLECGCHSVNIDFKSDDDRLDAAKRTADLWNCG